MFRLAAPVSVELGIRKSRFIGQLYPVATRAEAMAILAGLRVLHPVAGHICWVLICSADSGLDDDGEPSGTAARPMYNVLVHKQLMNVLAVVVRYWGGIKLGAGGLARAYSQAISDASKLAALIPIEILCQRRFVIGFADESALRRLCEQFTVRLLQTDYAEQVTILLEMPEQLAASFELAASDLLRGALRNITAQS